MAKASHIKRPIFGITKLVVCLLSLLSCFGAFAGEDVNSVWHCEKIEDDFSDEVKVILKCTTKKLNKAIIPLFNSSSDIKILFSKLAEEKGFLLTYERDDTFWKSNDARFRIDKNEVFSMEPRSVKNNANALCMIFEPINAVQIFEQLLKSTSIVIDVDADYKTRFVYDNKDVKLAIDQFAKYNGFKSLDLFLNQLREDAENEVKEKERIALEQEKLKLEEQKKVAELIQKAKEERIKYEKENIKKRIKKDVNSIIGNMKFIVRCDTFHLKKMDVEAFDKYVFEKIKYQNYKGYTTISWRKPEFDYNGQIVSDPFLSKEDALEYFEKYAVFTYAEFVINENMVECSKCNGTGFVSNDTAQMRKLPSKCPNCRARKKVFSRNPRAKAVYLVLKRDEITEDIDIN